MYNRILFPTDGSETATTAFEDALDIASTHDATVFVLNVADTTQDSVTNVRGEVVDVLEREGERIVEETAAHATGRTVTVETDVVQGEPYRVIGEYADRYDIDLIVMPTQGRSGLERFLLGSVTERVLNTATVPVLTLTPDAIDGEFAYPCRNVLVPTDGSTGADLALDAGIDFADASGAALHLLHVVETASLGIDVRSAQVSEALEERAEELLDAAQNTAENASLDDITTSVVYGRPFREILSYIEDNDVDVVVLGTHGETDFSRYALGGVSAKLIRTSPAPVMMVRGARSNESSSNER